MATKKFKGSQIVHLALAALAAAWAYCWGWNGERKVDAAACKKFGLDPKRWIGHYGADCSGLVTWINRVLKTGYGDTRAQGWYNRCKKLATAAYLQPGDLVFAADSKNHVYHVGVYVGDGYVVEEAGTATGIIKTRLPGGWNRYGRLPCVIDEPLTPELMIRTVTANSLYVRTGPGTTYKALGTVHRGDKLTLTGKTQGKWMEVQHGSGTAWCSGNYLA